MQSTLTEGFSAQAPDGKSSAYLFRVFDADRPLSPSARFSLDQIDEVLLGRADSRTISRTDEGGKRTLRVGIPDRWMSTAHARLSRVMRTWVLEDTKSKNGVRRNGEAVMRAELQNGDVLELGRTFWVVKLAEAPGVDLESDAIPVTTLSPSLALHFAEVMKLAKSNVSIALHGPSGSGKEVLARAIHEASGRKGPFIAVNCGALPDDLVESELFGHRKGAFSGALEDRPGLIRSSSGGTLLFDEVGDLPLEAQPALLRVLQEKQVVPVGGAAHVPVDLRVLSATHRKLGALCEKGLFRDDLRARLTGYEATLPALVDRREDLGLMIGALISRYAPQRQFSIQFSIAAARALFAFDWPLNVRELEKALEAALVFASSGTVELEHLPPAVRTGPVKRAVKDADELRSADESAG
ncbi:MAG: sigma 54-interacting transcriptional regulator, partial [Archangium sp.]|nr:sigma 54-interacting transcriptional regulator [Archangium sp.]